MRYSILFGGKAGQGPNVLTNLLGEALVNQGYYVFYSRDYQSLIRGGHNFNVLTFSDKKVHSNDGKIDILVALDEKTATIHKGDLKPEAVVLKGEKPNMYFAGRIFKLLCIDFSVLEGELKKLGRRFEDNVKEAKKGYEEEKQEVCQIKHQKHNIKFTSGSREIAQGAVKSGMDIYYAYPMTPATPILGELAGNQEKENYLVLELENEISVINAAIGSAITGTKVMVGTSGGGFDLMTEGLSLAGITEAPLVLYLAQRPGPASGVPTYTGQADLNMARHSGHGEFPRMVLAPGDPTECEEMINQAFYFSQKYKLPVIVISDKHLAESFYSVTDKPVLLKSPKTTKLGRYNSYEKDKHGSATNNPKIIEKNVIARLKKGWDIEKEALKFEQYKIMGNKNSKNLIISWGSTKGAIIDSMKDLDVCFLQILYMDPFPKSVQKYFKDKNLILIENNSTAQLGTLIAEKTGVFVSDKKKILRFDARPFLADELKVEIKKRLK